MPYSSDDESTPSNSDVENDMSNEKLNDSESESHEDMPEPPEPKKTLTSVDILETYNTLKEDYEELVSSFRDKEKQLEKQLEHEKKDFLSDEKKMLKELNSLLKKLTKKLPGEVGKRKKKAGNKNGGFNKEIPVPKKLCKYLELDEDTLMSRPKVTKLLNAKFKEAGFKMTDGSKKTVISDGKVAKKLGCKKNFEIEWNKFQSFLATFYNEEKQKSEHA